MTSREEQSRSTGQNNKRLTSKDSDRVQSSDPWILNALFRIPDKGVLDFYNSVDKGSLELNPKRDFIKGALSGIGVDFDETYKISDLIKIFNARGIEIKSICGIKYPGNINPESADVMNDSEFNLRVFSKAIYETQEEAENFCKIVRMMNDSFKIDEAIIQELYSMGNEKYFIHLRSSVDSIEKKFSVITVEIS